MINQILGKDYFFLRLKEGVGDPGRALLFESVTKITHFSRINFLTGAFSWKRKESELD